MVIFHSYVTVYQRVSETSQWKSFTKKTWILHQHPASIHYIHYISLWKIKQKTTKKLKKPSIKSIQSYEKRYEKIHENRRFSFRPFEAMISISCEEVTKEPCNEFRCVEWSLSEKQSRGKSLRFFWLRLWSNGMAVVFFLWVKYLFASPYSHIFSMYVHAIFTRGTPKIPCQMVKFLCCARCAPG